MYFNYSSFPRKKIGKSKKKRGNHFAPLSFFYLDRKLFLIFLDTQQFNFENQSRERFDLAA